MHLWFCVCSGVFVRLCAWVCMPVRACICLWMLSRTCVINYYEFIYSSPISHISISILLFLHRDLSVCTSLHSFSALLTVIRSLSPNITVNGWLFYTGDFKMFSLEDFAYIYYFSFALCYLVSSPNFKSISIKKKKTSVQLKRTALQRETLLIQINPQIV